MNSPLVITGIAPRPRIIASQRTMHSTEINIKNNVREGMLNLAHGAELAGHDLATVLTEAKKQKVEITGLDLSRRLLVPANLQAIGRSMPDLKLLKLNGANYSSTTSLAVALREFSKLEWLYLEGVKLKDEHFAGFGDASFANTLTRLNIAGTEVTESTLTAELSKLRILQRLNIAGMNITAEGAEAIKDRPTLTWLDLTGTRLDFHEIEAIAEGLPLNKLIVADQGVSEAQQSDLALHGIQTLVTAEGEINLG